MTFRPVDFRFLLDQYGKAVTYRSVSEGTYSTATGGLTGGSNTDKTVKVYFYNYNLGEIDGTNIKLGDRRAVLHTLDTSGNAISEPDIGDQFIGEGDTVKVVGIQKVFSDSLVCYICQVRE